MTIKVRYSDFTTITRSNSTSEAFADPENIVARALKLLDKTEAGHRPVRLLGVSVHNFGGENDGEEDAEAEGRLRSSASLSLLRFLWPWVESASHLCLICGQRLKNHGAIRV